MTEMPSAQRISARSISLRACGLVSAAEIPPFPAIGLGLVPTFGQKRPPQKDPASYASSTNALANVSIPNAVSSMPPIEATSEKSAMYRPSQFIKTPLKRRLS